MINVSYLKYFSIIFLFFFLCSCITLHKDDAFPVPAERVSIAVLKSLLDSDTNIFMIPSNKGSQAIAAYYIQHPKTTGILIVCGGSGNEIIAPIKNMAGRTKKLGLDLVVFPYYEQGESVPYVSEVRAKVMAIYTAVKMREGSLGKSIYVMGYSLGGWFALDLASKENISGLILVGAETTQEEVIKKTNLPWSHFVSIHQDNDTRQLDASIYIPDVKAPALVITSNKDEQVPVSIARKLYSKIPKGISKKFLILNGYSHGRYFLSNELWTGIGDFFSLKK